MKKKLLIGLGAITAVVTPIVAVVSCGSSSKKVNVSDFKVGGGSTTNNPTGSQTGSNGVVNHQPTGGVSNPVVNTPSHSSNTITNTWTAPTFTATPRAAGSHESADIAAIPVDVLKTGFSFGGTDNAGSLYNNGSVKSSGFRYDFVYKTSSNMNKSKNQLSNGDVITVNASTSTGDPIDLGDVTVSGLHAAVSELNSWQEFVDNFPQKIQYSNGVPVGLLENAMFADTINNSRDGHITLKAGFKFPDTLNDLAGSVFRNTIWEDGVTLANTAFTSFPSDSFANATFGKKFELPNGVNSYGLRSFINATFNDAFVLKGIGPVAGDSMDILTNVKATSGFEIDSRILVSQMRSGGIDVRGIVITDGGHWVDAGGQAMTTGYAKPGWYITK